MTKRELRFGEVYNGLEVVDDEGDEGIILECDDSCNILVKYTNGGMGMYCLNPGCSEYGLDILYVIDKPN